MLYVGLLDVMFGNDGVNYLHGRRRCWRSL